MPQTDSSMSLSTSNSSNSSSSSASSAVSKSIPKYPDHPPSDSPKPSNSLSGSSPKVSAKEKGITALIPQRLWGHLTTPNIPRNRRKPKIAEEFTCLKKRSHFGCKASISDAGTSQYGGQPLCRSPNNRKPRYFRPMN